MQETYLDCVVCEPEGAARAAVIWLHGLGADGHDFEPIVPHLAASKRAVRFVFPHAPRRPVTINGGLVMRAWYDIRAMSLSRDVDEAGVLDSSRRVDALIRRENERGVPTERIVLAGFSQGGAVALHLGLRYPQRLAGVVALSTYLVRDESLEAERAAVNDDVPIFQAHGSFDPMVPPEAGQLAHDRLTALGYRASFRLYRMGHEVCPDEIRDLSIALDGFLVK